MIKSINLLLVAASLSFSGAALADNHENKAAEKASATNTTLVPGQPVAVEPSKSDKMAEKEAYWHKKHEQAMAQYNALSFEDKKKYSLKRIAAMQRKLDASKACVEAAQTEEALASCKKYPKRSKNKVESQPAVPAK